MKFLRQDYMRHSKLGKNRKKLQKWRRPKGIHSKMRRQRKGYPVSPSVGYKRPKTERNKINGHMPILINNLNDLGKIKKDCIAVLSGNVGARKKIEIIKKAEEMKIKILNLGVKK